MTWAAQVRHVMMKDLRQLRWSLVIYGLVVAVVAGYIVAWPATTNGVFEYFMFIVVLLGMILSASLVQADSPTRGDAFWASRPFYPSAVLGAKIATAGIVLVGVASLGELAALHSFDISARELPAMLAQSAWLCGLWLLVAIILGALTEDLRTFITALVLMPLSILLLAMVAFSSAVTNATRGVLAHVILALIGVLGGMALLAVLYRTRDTRKRAWGGAFVALASIFFFATSASEVAPAEALATAPRAQVQVELQRPADIVRGHLQLHLVAVGADDSDQSKLITDTISIGTRDGSVFRIPAATPVSFAPVTLHRPDLPVGRGVRWLGTHVEPTWNDLSVPLDAGQRTSLSGGVSTVSVHGRIYVAEPRLIGTIPFEPKRSLVRNGVRVRIVKTSHDAVGASADLFVATLVRGREATSILFTGVGNLAFALVNPVRAEAIMLTQGSSGGADGWLVLPGTRLQELSAHLETNPSGAPPGSEIVPDDAWYKNARLAVVRWVPRGSYAVSATSTVP